MPHARTFLVVVALLASGLAGAAPARAADAPIQEFFGQYSGRTLFPMGEVSNRDMRLAIRPYGVFGGFTVFWETTTFRDGATGKTKRYLYSFQPTANPNVFAAVKRQDEAGNPIPADPMSGHPYAWARLEGEALTINVITISESGDLVHQVYQRSLTSDGLRLEFRRFQNGKAVREIKGSLKREAE